MSYFTLLHRLLYFWEICNSFSHAIRYSIEEAIRLQLIKPQSFNTADIPPMRPDPRHGMPKLSFLTIVSLLLPTTALTLILILKISRLRTKKKKFHNYKTILKVNKEDRVCNEERRNSQVLPSNKLTETVNFLREGRYVADTYGLYMFHLKSFIC